MFLQFCNFLEVFSSTTSNFQVRTNRGKQQYYNKLQQIRYFNIINIAHSLCKNACISEGLVFKGTLIQIWESSYVSWCSYDSNTMRILHS